MLERLQALSDRFEEAAARHRWHERWLRVADRAVRLRVVGEALLESLWRPLAHLAAPPEQPALTLDLWDAECTGVPSPIAPGTHRLEQEGRLALQRLPGTVTGLDRGAGRLIACRLPTRATLYELGRPLHEPLALWLRDQGSPLVHAGLVSLRGRGVLLAGPAGRGKSTTALRCLLQGWSFVSDDRVALREEVGYGLYATSFASDPTGLAGEPARAEGEKPLHFLFPDYADRLAASSPIAAVVVPDPDGPTGLLPASQALLALAPSSLLVGPLSTGPAGLEPLARLVSRVPCYRLGWGPEPGRRLEEMLP